MGRKFRTFLEMIKFEHTIFALPFAYLGAFLAAGGLPTFRQFIWVSLAMVGARTAAMSLNRLIDRHIDALNPRTQNRALPRGILSVLEVWIYTAMSFALLYISASMLNPLCVKLMPIAVIILVGYSYIKRWSWICHLVLGVADGLAPLGAWVAITGRVELPGILLGLVVAFWVAGFDLIYACQDVDFDQQKGIHSIPARFGLKAALLTSRMFHLAALALLVAVGFYLKLGIFYGLGVAGAAILLHYEHRLISPKDLSKIGMAFMNINGYLSVMMFVATLLDLLVTGGK
ncbi:MAG: UbiA-like polyprenyltransferase [Bacillota bacterium]